jgi:exosome complex exonuclease DIS3/RRP44
LGIEGLVLFKRESTTFNADAYTLSVSKDGGNKLDVSVFDKVLLSIKVERDRNTQREKVKMELIGRVES